jgi:hypothetical protein
VQAASNLPHPRAVEELGRLAQKYPQNAEVQSEVASQKRRIHELMAYEAFEAERKAAQDEYKRTHPDQ